MLLKVATDDPKTWSEWTRQYKIDGDGIPKVYVVRADGEQLYGKTGAPQMLPQFLSTALRLSGRIPKPSELKRLTQAVELANQAVEDGDIARVSTIVARSKSDGVFAEPAVQLRAIISRLTEDGKTALADSIKPLQGDELSYKSCVALVEVERKYGRLPELRIAIANAVKDVRRDSRRRDVYEQAKLVDRAQGYETANKKRSALVAWKQLVARYPGSPAADLAQKRITELGE